MIHSITTIATKIPEVLNNGLAHRQLGCIAFGFVPLGCIVLGFIVLGIGLLGCIVLCFGCLAFGRACHDLAWAVVSATNARAITPPIGGIFAIMAGQWQTSKATHPQTRNPPIFADCPWIFGP